MRHRQVNFDRIARPYWLLEYITLGRALERTREHFLSALKDAKNALVLGDGDGRFLAKLLEENPQLRATAVDTSVTMLHLLGRRCERYADRLQIQRADVRRSLPHGVEPYDLVVTHFFLDCLTSDELRLLVQRVKSLLAPCALWVVSDFRIPKGVLRLPAWLFVGGLYLCFRALTGLRTTHLPNHAAVMTNAGFVRIDRRFLLGGVLTTEIWRADVKNIR